MTGPSRLEVLGGGAVCAEAVAPANTCSADVSFVDVATPSLVFQAIQTPNGTPDAEDLREQAARILSAFPVADLDYDTRVLLTEFDPAPSTNEMNEALLEARAVNGEPDIYLGVALGSDGTGRAAGIPANAASWYVDGTGDRDAAGYVRNRGAHELGHAVGEYHSSDASGQTICARDENVSDAAPLFPFIETVDGTVRATLGPLGDDDTEVWGLDTRFVREGNSQLAIQDPEEVFSLMSYCGIPGDPTQQRWTDAFHHARFIDAVNGIDWNVGANPPGPGIVDRFIGWIGFDAADNPTPAVFSPIYTTIGGPTPDPVPAGDFTLELRDGAGQVVLTVPFEPIEQASDVDEKTATRTPRRCSSSCPW